MVAGGIFLVLGDKKTGELSMKSDISAEEGGWEGEEESGNQVTSDGVEEIEDVRIPRDLRKWSAGVWFNGVWGDLDMTSYWEHSVSPQW